MAGIFLDSGAFTVYTKKVKIDIQEYIEFLYKNKDKLDVYCNLDVIDDVEATWKNFEIMKKAGLDPLPVFHPGEDFKYLRRCLEYDYFCIGTGATIPSKNKRTEFLDKAFSIICEKDGYPQAKVHGLGMTDFELMRRYPFFSVDSSSWKLHSAMGIALIPPRAKDGGYDYIKLPKALSFCNKFRKKPNDHFDNCSKEYRKWVIDYLATKGYTPEEIKASNVARAFVNLDYFKTFQGYLPDWPWKFKHFKFNFFH